MFPDVIRWGHPPGGLSGPGDADAWADQVVRWQLEWLRRCRRSLLGPTAPARKRPRRVQRKIDARCGAAKYRHAAIRRLLAEVTS